MTPTPTAKLRFVERKFEMDPFYRDIQTGGPAYRTYRVLQQWWAPFRTFSDGYGYQTVEQEGGEWRDVPLEQEQA